MLDNSESANGDNLKRYSDVECDVDEAKAVEKASGFYKRNAKFHARTYLNSMEKLPTGVLIHIDKQVARSKILSSKTSSSQEVRRFWNAYPQWVFSSRSNLWGTYQFGMHHWSLSLCFFIYKEASTEQTNSLEHSNTWLHLPLLALIMVKSSLDLSIQLWVSHTKRPWRKARCRMQNTSHYPPQ